MHSTEKGFKPLLWICSALVCLTALLGWLLVSKRSFTIGHTYFRFWIQDFSGKANPFNNKAVFINTGWDDPTGQITHGQAYGLRIRHFILRLDTYYSPNGFPPSY